MTPMQLGLHALGIGSGAQRDIIDQVASVAEELGFSTLWAGEHVAMFDSQDSRYPYTADGRIAVPAQADWLDPLITLSFAAAATTRIRLATGVLLLPEHNPLLLAKQAASLDSLCDGRLRLGIGVGWSREEFDALGIPFARRGARATEYAAAMRTLWRDDVASFDGEFTKFENVRLNPKPHTDRRIPITLGGNSEAALKRVAEWGDGWYGFNLDGVEAVRAHTQTLRRLCAEAGTDFDRLRLAVALVAGTAQDAPILAKLGVSELVLVDAPPATPSEVRGWLTTLASASGVM